MPSERERRLQVAHVAAIATTTATLRNGTNKIQREKEMNSVLNNYCSAVYQVKSKIKQQKSSSSSSTVLLLLLLFNTIGLHYYTEVIVK